MEYDDKIDHESISLCDAVNKIKGLKTFESCCGHNRDNFLIWFSAENVVDLTPLVYFLDK